ncbi:DNA polymerase III subunit gamma and tau [Actinoplanes derwentensis]|uniref:DNA-directed DNA polymerase n=1 Tax=Actinoplanes derwentensis TaxID=113562 RepID=A0A1H2CY02_9ACTN|nr:DNA polymerase III subunit gamma and tau [Actinoplanes derwentensis]GID82837.1 hypothetical protein Ade03nite_17610 [Actinoplanes derwentensis]SDT75179.1 DNA polymerase-3 subunit gamma/tau [Actinoplanes derwentensis]
MALALYRKYRPRTFAEIIGQEHVTEPLSQALRSGRLNHAYLFSGPRGCGKTSSARILARSLNCEQGPTPDPCGECLSCKSLANDGAGSIDVIEIDAASHGGVDDARELREKAFFAPANSRYKIYVIDEAHMVSSAGFNALLKLVEEPPDYVKFIFATTEPDKVLGTIRSRTHHYPFRLIPPAVLRPYLQKLTEAEGVTVEPSVLPLVVRAGGGSARDSLSILDQLIAGSGPAGVTYSGAVALLGVTDSALIDEMCEAIAAGQGAAAYATIDRVADAGHEPRRFASDLLERFRDLIILQQVPDAVAKGLIDGPADQLEAMAVQAASLGAATLSRCADILHNGLIEMRGTTAPRLLLELVTARMLLPGADASTSALLQRLERLEQGVVVRGELPASTPAPIDAPGGAAQPPFAGAPSGDQAAASDGAARGGKAAAMAAARAALSRQSAGPARPVSPAPAAPASPAPVAAAPAVPASGSAGPASGSGAGSAGQASGSARHTDSGATGAEPDWNQVAAGRESAPADAGYDDEPPPWDEEPPEPDEPIRRAPAGARPPARSNAAESESSASDARRPASNAPQSGGEAPQPADDAMRPDDDATQPVGDAPDSEGIASAVRTDGRLEQVRAAWQALGQHQSKVKAMQDYGIGVREVDGELIVFAAPTQALVDRFLNWKDAIAAEFRKSPGGNWRIRCEVGGIDVPSARSGTSSRTGSGQGQGGAHPAAGGAHQGTAGPPGRAAPERNAAASSAAPERNTGRTESRPSRPEPAPAADADDEWPAPSGAAAPTRNDAGTSTPAAGQSGSAGLSGADGSGRSNSDVSRPASARTGDSGRVEAPSGDSGWPEPARPGGSGSGADDSADNEWPEPVKPGSGLASAGASVSDEDSAWPEPVRPGGGLSGGSASGNAEPHDAGEGKLSAGSGPGDALGNGDSDEAGVAGAAASGAERGVDAGVGHGDAAGHAGAGLASGGAGGGAASGGVSGGAASGGVAVSAAPRDVVAAVPPSGGKPVAARSAAMEAARAAARMGTGAVGRTAERDVSNGAAVGSAPAGARGGAAGKPGGGAAFAQARAAAAGGASTWADGSPIGEAPYDPEYDGPPSGEAALEGFDPGDEPSDEVIDEKTARASSEEQVMQLLREAFGAEKIGEL